MTERITIIDYVVRYGPSGMGAVGMTNVTKIVVGDSMALQHQLCLISSDSWHNEAASSMYYVLILDGGRIVINILKLCR
jgi:hypothetical protein